MILYFTSTNNCKYIATKIAEALNDKAASILDAKEINLSDGETLGLVTPTYFWSLPSIVIDFLKEDNIKSASNNYVFVLSTYGTMSGTSAKDAAELLVEKGLKINARYTIKTIDDWTVQYDVSNKERNAKILAKEATQLSKIIKDIKSKKEGDFAKGKIPKAITNVARGFYESARETKHLHVEDTCIGCSLCERNCPVKAIEMKDKKPIWVKEKCVMCLRCLHACPKFAIQYDNKTKNRGQYKHPNN